MDSRSRVILAELDRRQHITVSELSRLLEVSEVTIRADLTKLERDGHLRRTRGGATRPLLLDRELPIEESRKQNAHAKRRIGQAAAALVQDGETIFLDVGSTTTEIARHLSPALQDVTVVTNGLNIALELERLGNLNIVVTGGTLRRLQHSLVSPFGAQLLSRFRPDRLFLGCNGVCPKAGVTNRNLEEAEIKSCMVELAQNVTVVADHSKLGQVTAAAIAPLSLVHCLITDRAADAEQLSMFARAGLQVMTV